MIQPDAWPIADAVRTTSPLVLVPAQTPLSLRACAMKSRAAGSPTSSWKRSERAMIRPALSTMPARRPMTRFSWMRLTSRETGRLKFRKCVTSSS